MTTPAQRSPLKPAGRTYSRIGTFIAISLAVFSFIVVPIKMFADGAPAAGFLLLGLASVLVLVITLALKVPVRQREGGTYETRAPMELDPEAFDPRKDGVSW